MARARRKEYRICPHCGTEFVAGRLACPECGSDENTGWKSAEEISYQSVEIPDTYDPAVWENGGKPKTPRWLVVTAYVVIVAFLISVTFFGISALMSAL